MRTLNFAEKLKVAQWLKDSFESNKGTVRAERTKACSKATGVVELTDNHLISLEEAMGLVYPRPVGFKHHGQRVDRMRVIARSLADLHKALGQTVPPDLQSLL